MKLSTRLIGLLQERRLTLAFAESMTCGLAAEKLSVVKGVSQVLIASVVCYHENAKKDLLNVSESMLRRYSAESHQVTERMAQQLFVLLRADICAAITGLASPGGSETKAKPVGTVFYAIVFQKRTHTIRKKFRGNPAEIRKKSCEFLYREIIRMVKSVQ